MSELLYWIIVGIILGILQGTLEWIPISSEGILFLVSILLGLSPLEALSLAIFLHFASALAVIIRFRQEYWDALRSIVHKDEKGRKILELLILGTVFSAIIALPLRLYENVLLQSASVVIIVIIIGILMIIVGIFLYKVKTSGNKMIWDGNRREFLCVGIAEGLAVLPGVSRSGITMTVFLLMNYRSDEAVRGSFLMLAPIAILAGLYELFVSKYVVFIFVLTVIAFIVALIISLFVIDIMLRIARKINAGLFLSIIGFLLVIGAVLSFCLKPI